MFGVALILFACESMEPSGHPFAPAARSSEAAAPTAAAPVATASDPEFAFPLEPPLQISSEEMAATVAPAGSAAPALEAVAVDAPATPDVLAHATGPEAWGIPATTRWPVRLLSTLPAAQPPRAILGLPSGEERVVSPGSILAEEGLVVMAVSAGRVQLARIEAAGDHAAITTLELSAQYP